MKKAAASQLLVLFLMVFSYTANAQIASAGGHTFTYSATAKVGGKAKDTKGAKAAPAPAAITKPKATTTYATKQHLNLLPEVGYAYGANKPVIQAAETNGGSPKTMSEELEAWVANELTLKKSRHKIR